ncbi:MAG: hypothetical protein Q9200_005798 [Gallowayella weberi]
MSMVLLNQSPQIGLEVDERSRGDGNDVPIAVLPPEDKITTYDDGKIIDFNDGGKYVAAIPTPSATTNEHPEPGVPKPRPQILGLNRNTFIALLSVVLVIILGVAVGGGVGGTRIAHEKKEAGILTVPTSTAPLRQRAPGKFTPLVTHYSNPPVKNVYYMTTTDELFEHQASSNDSQRWKEDNFSGLYRGSNSTYLAAYWNQDFYHESQQLVVLFQEEDIANGITQGRYTSNSRTSNPWVADKFGFSQPQGSAFALCPVTNRSGKQIALYTVDGDRVLRQQEYIISEANLDPGTVIS